MYIYVPPPKLAIRVPCYVTLLLRTDEGGFAIYRVSQKGYALLILAKEPKCVLYAATPCT